MGGEGEITRTLGPRERFSFSDFFPHEAMHYLRLNVSCEGKVVEERACLDKYSYVALLGTNKEKAHILVHLNENPNELPAPPDKIVRMLAQRIQDHVSGSGFHYLRHAGCNPENMTLSTFYCYNEGFLSNGFIRGRHLGLLFEQITGNEVEEDEIIRLLHEKPYF